MAELTIDITDYVSFDRVRELAEDEVRMALRKSMRSETEVQRVLTNLSYEYVFKLVEEECGLHADEFRAKLHEMAMRVLDDDSLLRYEIFRRADAWGKTESPAVKWLDEALAESKPKIVEIVNQRIEQYPFNELREYICDTIYECIEAKLLRRADNGC